MKFVIGMDGGGTKMLMRASNLKGEKIGEIVSTTASHRIIGMEKAKNKIEEMIYSLMKENNLKKEDCEYIVLGGSGVDSENDRHLVESILEEINIGCPFAVMNDIEIALYASVGEEGAVVISGTGSIAASKNKKGQFFRSGGYGTYVYSDEGSGGHISLVAMKYMGRYFDEMIEGCLLTDEIIKAYNLDRESYVELTFQIGYEGRRVNDLAKIVVECAEKGDALSIKILKDSAKDLFEIAESVIVKAGLDKEETFKVSAWGSVILNSNILFNEYKNLIEKRFNNAKIVYPTNDAAQGAVLLGISRI